MKHGSLFSGIGGFDLAAQRMGWENVFHCEKNEFGRKVLNHYWPESISYEDVTTTDFTIHAGTIDVLTGGFPCQPYSTAGKRLGKEDDRHLWPEMLRAIREVKPGYVVGENVRGLLSWNGGMVFDEVQTDLESEGYEVLPFLLPACAVNAPHRRDRIWFVAYAKGQQDNRWGQGGLYAELTGVDAERATAYSPSNRRERKGSSNENENRKQRPGIIGQLAGRLEGLGVSGDAADTSRTGWEEQYATTVPNAKGHCTGRCHANVTNSTSGGRLQDYQEQRTEQFTQGISDWRSFPTQSPICGGDDGLPTELDGITLSRHRRESIKAYGNAIVPQVAYQIFKAIEETQLSITT